MKKKTRDDRSNRTSYASSSSEDESTSQQERPRRRRLKSKPITMATVIKKESSSPSTSHPQGNGEVKVAREKFFSAPVSPGKDLPVPFMTPLTTDRSHQLSGRNLHVPMPSSYTVKTDLGGRSPEARSPEPLKATGLEMSMSKPTQQEVHVYNGEQRHSESAEPTMPTLFTAPSSNSSISVTFEEKLEMCPDPYHPTPSLLGLSLTDGHRDCFVPNSMQCSVNNFNVLVSHSCATQIIESYGNVKSLPVAVQKFEGSTYMSIEAKIPANWDTYGRRTSLSLSEQKDPGFDPKVRRASLTMSQKKKDPTYDTSEVCISPDATYLSLTSRVLKRETRATYGDFATLPSAIAALSNDRIWCYVLKPTDDGGGMSMVDLQAYTYANTLAPCLTVRTPIAIPSPRKQQQTGTLAHNWLHQIRACSNPNTGDMAVVYGFVLFIVYANGATKAVSLDYAISTKIHHIQPSLVHVTSTRHHILIVDAYNNIRAHAWRDGSPATVITASELKLGGLEVTARDQIVGIGYTCQFGKEAIRVLTLRPGNHYVYRIFKIEEN